MAFKQKKSWVSGLVRAERVQADAIDLQILFGDQCVDAGALQALRERHLHGLARSAQTGDLREQ